MSELVVLVLVILQLFAVCCCVCAIQKYCVIPIRLARRMIRKFIDDPEERENAQASAQVQSSTIAASPVLPTQMPSVPSIYPQSAVPPYPIHQLKPVYPHEMGFCLPSSSLQATVITMESHIVAENPQGESINNTKDV